QTLLPDDFALMGLEFALQKAEKRGLARAIATEDTDPLARLNREIGLVQNRRAAEAQANVGKCDQRHSSIIEATPQFGKPQGEMLQATRTPSLTTVLSSGYRATIARVR